MTRKPAVFVAVSAGAVIAVVVTLIASKASNASNTPSSTNASNGAHVATANGSNVTNATNTSESKADLIAHGKRIAMTSGCNDCHTPGFFYGAADESRAFSGSELGWAGPWGETFSANLTPDKQTGIGSWTDDQIVAAIRTGVRPDRTVLRPPMPWQDFANFSDADVHALVAYLRSVPAVHHVVPTAVAPGQPPKGTYFKLPLPPPAWDAPKHEHGSNVGTGTSAEPHHTHTK